MTPTQEMTEAFRRVNDNMEAALENLRECNRLMARRNTAEADAVNDFLHERNAREYGGR